MTKQELIEQFAKESRMAFQDAKEIVNTIFNEMALRLKNNERVELRGFGSFNVKSYEGYNGRNPRTGESVYVAPKKMPYFRVGKELRDRVNSGYADS